MSTTEIQVLPKGATASAQHILELVEPVNWIIPPPALEGESPSSYLERQKRSFDLIDPFTYCAMISALDVADNIPGSLDLMIRDMELVLDRADEMTGGRNSGTLTEEKLRQFQEQQAFEEQAREKKARREYWKRIQKIIDEYSTDAKNSE